MLRSLLARDRLLTLTSAAMVAGLVIIGAVGPFATRTMTGINL